MANAEIGVSQILTENALFGGFCGRIRINSEWKTIVMTHNFMNWKASRDYLPEKSL